MTPQEAINHGKEQLEIFGGEHKEFIELAIKALEQTELNPSYNSVKTELKPRTNLAETSQDTISREALRQKLKEELLYMKRDVVADSRRDKALDLAIKALEIELLTDREQRIFLKAINREREVCQKVDDEYSDNDSKVSLVKVCNSVERKVKKIWE